MIAHVPSRFALLSAATAAIAAWLVFVTAAPTAESAGPYSVDGSAVRIEITQQGPCQPGALYAGYSVPQGALINRANPLPLRFTAPTNQTPGFRGCIAPQNGPQYLVIDNELFQYANIHTETTMPVDGTSQSFNLNVKNCLGFAATDLIYVGMELMQWDTGYCDGDGGTQDYIHITARPDTTDYAHGIGSYVRMHGVLLLVGRGGLPKFLDFNASGPSFNLPPTSDSFAYTPAVAHAAGALAHSPATYAVCIDRLTQTPGPGDDVVNARTRCSLILEPGYDAANCDSTPSSCYWPTSPPLDPAVLRRPVFPLQASWNLTSTSMPPQYDELRGFINDAGSGSVSFTYLPVSATGNCLLFFSLSPTDKLYLSSDMSIPTGIKNFTTGSSGTGTLTTRYFSVVAGAMDPCGGGQYVLTVPSSFTFIKLAPTAPTGDTDGDGCPDLKELAGDSNGVVSGQTAGGWRDPLNPYDFFDPVVGTGVRQVLVPDILAVVQQYFIDDLPGPIDLTSKTDRTYLGPNVWNLGPPDGLQRVPDILAVVKQYFDAC